MPPKSRTEKRANAYTHRLAQISLGRAGPRNGLIMRKNFLEADLLLQRALSAARHQGRRILELKARANLVVCAAHGKIGMHGTVTCNRSK